MTHAIKGVSQIPLTLQAARGVTMTSARGNDQTLRGALDELARRGFTEQLFVAHNRLRVAGTDKAFQAEEVVIREYRRFEGASDPDDMAIVFAIETKDGVRGTLVDGFGVNSDPSVSAFLEKVPIVKPAP